MTKKCATRFLILLIVYVLISGLAGIGFSAFASSGSHVFRASVVPRPEAAGPDTQALVRTEPVEAVSSAPKPPVKKTASSKTKPAVPKSEAAEQVTTPAPKQAAKPQAAEAKAKKSLADKAGPAKQAVKPGTSKDLYLNAQAALLINMSTGEVYYEHNPDKTIAPASITKLLTLYIIREALAQGKLAPTTPIPVSATAVKTGGSRMRLKRNEKVPLSELIKGISVVSANNACVAVAEYFGKGDPSKFVAQMNAKAKKIGMINSRFKNPNGLPASGQLSTARDIAKLSVAYLRTFPEALKVHSMTSHTYHGATHRNANTLLRTYKGVDGLKTGFVCDAGYNITATAKRGKTRLVAVVLGAQNSAVRQRETARLLDYGFRRAAKDEKLAKKPSGAAKKPEA
ncbi:D-alanyl-D-alanine carboxypeptidase (penicillin-binding protein 5/6) [Desulfomicrobium macestii]|uniref:D-alanyl-D-alanine carboxypeptidase (Penicillin-binding protein 5/6) n=1 Tax=Desulfomicrobium macestii TaxID=90731 RepID=A0ABR9H2T5_9BACT|nr:D-alanyl-D-alanine carboxypeptidase family protein [Desulfomicrobium macestii]MBE1424999.1 D-alanyl-D-alanine carboxypeptidase (penicillin-binding protein 5/6) [Desulfomicrobium macestii]